MVAMLLLLALQSAASTATTPPASPAGHPAPQKVCRREPGSEIVTCRPRTPQDSYRLLKMPPVAYGPTLPNADLGQGVKVRGHASNAGRARQNQPTATVSVPF